MKEENSISALPAASFFADTDKANLALGKVIFFFFSLDLPQNSKRTIFEL